MDSDETARFLAGAPGRRRLLTHLLRASGSPATLATDLDLSRRSVQRHLGAFVDRGWARKADGRYRLTTTGELVADEQSRHLETLDRIDRFDPVVRALPDREHVPDLRWLDDATLSEATAADPQAPIHHYLEAVRSLDTDRIRMVSPVLSRLFHGAHADVARTGAHTRLVLPSALVDRARESNPIEFRAVVSVGVLDLYRYPDEVGVGVTVTDDRALLSAYDDEGRLRTCVESTNPSFREWAGRLFERYRERSTAVAPSASPASASRD